MIFIKGAHQSAKFQNFDCLGEISPNLYFDRLLLLKVYKISSKKVRRSYVSLHWRVMQNLKKNWFVSKMTRIWWILIRALKSLKNLHFDWSLLCKVYNVWPKKVQRSYLSWHWRVMQNLKKNWLVAWKITWGIWQIFIKTLESVTVWKVSKDGVFPGVYFPVFGLNMEIYVVNLRIQSKYGKIRSRKKAVFGTELLCPNWYFHVIL